MGDRRFKALVSLVLVVGVCALAAYAYYTYTQARQIDRGMSTISVTGTSEQFLKPNIATFTFSVEAEDKEVAVAQKSSADAINAITAYLKEQGVEEKDIKTEAYNLYPRYEWMNETCTQWAPCPPGRQVFLGYTVNQTVSVKVRVLEKAGTLIGGVGELGATNVSGLSFTIDDEDEAQKAVREEAIKEAKAEAERLAETLGVDLGRLINYYEDGPGYPPMYGYGGDMMMEKGVSSVAASPVVTPGENKVTSRVTLIYEIR